MTINCKTPISYYGGKQNMIGEILPLIPEHKLYCEPFFGGGAVYFAKPPSQIEVINDLNDFVVNFYRVLKLRYPELKAEVDASLSSRSIHRKAGYIYKNPEIYCELKKAWALWYLANFSFVGKLNGGWKYDSVENKDCQTMHNKKALFSPELVRRIELTQIECDDAIKVIKSRDKAHSYFQLDPPYILTDQGHYAGYSIEKYTALLEACAHMKGKFMLSGFPNAVLQEYIDRYGWVKKEFTKTSTAKHTFIDDVMTRGKKTELLVMNYTIESKQLSAF
ncbi:DNA adenine methylase [Mucilaginibacter sp. ZT4R22]|uniref:DNA adenine methylase n=1 Tax=Mucilaginibacter pankratovii TaxID=2772110 RepID=A0ABR7WSZ8_9SPHI|nr:DNA adenine methylase [Mucilaginibacter pankratovii]MBD1364397.1 DNA adenine methylase [Mucilaginibacter pankratovii]